MLPLVRQARFLGRYREIARILGSHGFGYVVDQLGLISLLSLPRRLVTRGVPPTPPVSSASRLREVLIALGPTFVKLGQLLSTRPDLLPIDLTTELSKLQDTVPPFPAEQAQAIIERELGQPLTSLFREFDMTPIAAASLGQVHGAVLPDGTNVVVKIQRPDIGQRVATDLAILEDIAKLAQERLSIAEHYDLVGLAHEFTSAMRAELDYRREGRNADRFRHNFSDNPKVHVPLVYWEYTSPVVLTSERLYGDKITDLVALEAHAIDRRALARNSASLILQEIFVDGFFHADPHPGNFFALPNEVLGVVDFGQVGSLDRSTTRGLLRLLMATAQHDSDGVLRALEGLDLISRRDATAAFRRDVQLFTERFVDLPLSDLSARETIEALLNLLSRHRIRLPGTLATLLKALVMVEGIGLQLDPHLDIFGIARPYAQRALAEELSPSQLGSRLRDEGSDLARVALDMPHQLSELLQRAIDGELRIQIRDLEHRRLSQALLSAANRVAIGMVLAALIIGEGMLALAIGLGGLSGALPATLLIIGGTAILILSLFTVITWLRRE